MFLYRKELRRDLCQRARKESGSLCDTISCALVKAWIGRANEMPMPGTCRAAGTSRGRVVCHKNGGVLHMFSTRTISRGSSCRMCEDDGGWSAFAHPSMRSAIANTVMMQTVILQLSGSKTVLSIWAPEARQQHGAERGARSRRPLKAAGMLSSRTAARCGVVPFAVELWSGRLKWSRWFGEFEGFDKVYSGCEVTRSFSGLIIAKMTMRRGSVGVSRPQRRHGRQRSPARLPRACGRPPRRPSDSARRRPGGHRPGTSAARRRDSATGPLMQ